MIHLLEYSLTVWALQLLIAFVNLGGSLRPAPTTGPGGHQWTLNHQSAAWNILSPTNSMQIDADTTPTEASGVVETSMPSGMQRNSYENTLFLFFRSSLFLSPPMRPPLLERAFTD